MDLTQRKKQFLDKIMDLYQQTKLPVHNETLAPKIGVSKWTAYDMVKELEKLNDLKRDYALNPGETGRSPVVYLPIQKQWSMICIDHLFGHVFGSFVVWCIARGNGYEI